MTTTTTRQAPRVSGSRVLVGAAVVALLVGAFVVALGALLAGSDAAYGAALGAGITAAVFLAGALVVNVVASLVPTASLLVALMTYVLQVVLIAAVFSALTDAAAFEDPSPRQWLAAGVIAATATWIVAHIWFATRQRIPLYDLPPTEPSGAGAGGER